MHLYKRMSNYNCLLVTEPGAESLDLLPHFMTLPLHFYHSCTSVLFMTFQHDHLGEKIHMQH
jgi:hypothetical protein